VNFCHVAENEVKWGLYETPSHQKLYKQKKRVKDTHTHTHTEAHVCVCAAAVPNLPPQRNHFDQPSLACIVCGRSYSNTLTVGSNVTFPPSVVVVIFVLDGNDAVGAAAVDAMGTLKLRLNGRKHDRCPCMGVGSRAEVEDTLTICSLLE